MPRRLVLLGTGVNCPAGVLTWDGWRALRDAEFVYAREDLQPGWEVALADAGIVVHPVSLDVSPAELTRRLLMRADQTCVAWFGSSDGDPGLAQALTVEMLRSGQDAPELELVLGSWDEPGAGVLELVRLMDRLRSPGGCPWDAEQTHISLVPYALEEAFEVAEAIEDGTRDDLVEELGDLLLQVVFHARLGQERADPQERFDLDEIASGIAAKLRRRHPHVFADADAATAADVERNWERIKQEEKSRESAFDGLPVALPALARAQKVLGRFERAGLDVPAELLGGGPAPAAESAAGNILVLAEQALALAARARQEGVDLESAVRSAVRRLEQRGRAAEVSRLGT